MKVCFICFEFREENIRRQPWRYIYEISKGLAHNGVEIVVITDAPRKMIGDVKIRNIEKLTSPFRVRKELIEAIREENPDIVITLLGMTNFLSLSRLKNRLNKPIVGILTSPIYSFRDVLKVGASELIRHRNYLAIHILGALIPRFMMRMSAMQYDCIVTLSEENRRKLERIRVKSKLLTIRPGIDDHFLKLPNREKVEKIRQEINPKSLPMIMYFTSPLTLRGTDTLVKAFIKVRKIMPSKLVILSRLDHKELIKEEAILRKIAIKGGISDSIEIVSKILTPDDMTAFLSVTDIVSLPFKLVISDAPISILEAMALGKPVISTKVGSIPELLEGRGLVVEPNNHKELYDAIIKLLKDKELCSKLGKEGRKYMESYPRWNEVMARFFELIKELAS